MICFPILMFKHFVVRKTKSFITYKIVYKQYFIFSKLLQKREYGEGWSPGAPWSTDGLWTSFFNLVFRYNKISIYDVFFISHDGRFL